MKNKKNGKKEHAKVNWMQDFNRKYLIDIQETFN